jgi:hypothetical protein
MVFQTNQQICKEIILVAVDFFLLATSDVRYDVIDQKTNNAANFAHLFLVRDFRLPSDPQKPSPDNEEDMSGFSV